MKLLGTHVYPKNKYLTLQMTRSAKGVACEDVFESMIVFSEAWWVGTKEENPDELKLEFPKEMQNAAEDVDFKGGAGAASGEVVTVNKPRKQAAVPRTAEPRTPEPHTPEYESDADSEDSDVKDEIGTQTTSDTPVRKSARTAGKTFKFAELAGGDSAESDTEIEFAEDLDEKMKTEEIKEEIPGEDIKEEIPSEDIKPEDSPAESLSIKKQPLVQANLSTMFKKAEEKKVLLLRSREQLQRKNSHQRRRKCENLVQASMATPSAKASGSQKKQKAKVEEDEIEELSGDPSQDDDAAPAKKQRGTPKGKQSAAKKEASGSRKKKKAKVLLFGTYNIFCVPKCVHACEAEGVVFPFRVTAALQDDDMGEEEDDDSDDDWAGSRNRCEVVLINSRSISFSNAYARLCLDGKSRWPWRNNLPDGNLIFCATFCPPSVLAMFLLCANCESTTSRTLGHV
ncbi:hypothetical protein TRIUR3_20440 [Triticum urartu]|uniref:DNA-binding protein RHL1 n=1 Tax=Triticum urartu TaxID=4572 RepID=M8A4R6_TRIUA|nr:hypothetical protein TRIUR3_20440 [Triticum urartu]